MFKSFKLSVLVVAIALLELAALPAYPQTETASVKLRPAEVETPGSFSGRISPAPHGRSPKETRSRWRGVSLSVPRLNLENIPVLKGNSHVELAREGIIRIKEGGVPWKEGPNTTIVGHRLGYVFTKLSYVFYELDKMKSGDEVTLRDSAGKEHTFRVYDFLTVRPEDYWVTYPVPGKPWFLCKPATLSRPSRTASLSAPRRSRTHKSHLDNLD